MFAHSYYLYVSYGLLRTLTSGVLYLGPETIMPLASIIAAAIGILLIAWRYIRTFLKKAFQVIRYKVTGASPEEVFSEGSQEGSQDESSGL